MCSQNQVFDQFAVFDCLMLEDKRLKLGKSQLRCVEISIASIVLALNLVRRLR